MAEPAGEKVWPKERSDGSCVWADGSLCMPPPGECTYCDNLRETPGPGGFFPSHNGSKGCYGMPYSIAKAGPNGRSHCTCDACF